MLCARKSKSTTKQPLDTGAQSGPCEFRSRKIPILTSTPSPPLCLTLSDSFDVYSILESAGHSVHKRKLRTSMDETLAGADFWLAVQPLAGHLSIPWRGDQCAGNKRDTRLPSVEGRDVVTRGRILCTQIKC